MRRRYLMLGIIYCFCLPAFSLAASAADRKEVVRQARQSYYSLKNEGMVEIRCQVLMNWDSMFNAIKSDDVGRDQVLPILKKTSFQVLIGPEGASSVTNRSDVAPPNEEVAARIRKSTSGIEQVLTGFFQTWAMFTISPPLPEPESEYQIEYLDGKYLLTYKEGPANIATSMTHDFAIDEMKVTMPELEAVLRPSFDRSQNQHVLIGYESTNKLKSGDPQQISVKIENQAIDNLILPRTIVAWVPTPVGRIEFLLTFADYQVKRR